MNLLFTGASGFLGKNVFFFIKNKYQIKTIGLDVNDFYKIDLSKCVPSLDQKNDIVLHAAGRAHSMPRTVSEEKLFYDVNYQGTKNLCRSLEESGTPKSFIFVSTVAVYGREHGENITEDHPLDGNTPYALSKIQAERFLTNWCTKHNVTLGIIRPSLIAGPNPPGNLGAMISGIKTGRYLSIARGEARKSVLMVQDIARLIPQLAEKGGIYNICDSYHPTFFELEGLICKQLNKKRPRSIPYWFAKGMAVTGDLIGNKAPINSLTLTKMTKSLTFSNEKAKRELGWEPLSVLDNFIIE